MQWERLQQQLRAEQAKEEFESAEVESPAHRETIPWLALIVTVLVYAQAAAVGGPVGQFSLLVAIPGFIAAMLRGIPVRPFLLAILILSGGMILAPEWNIVAPRLHALLQHDGPLVFAGIALLVYLIALGATGLENGENHI